MTEELKQLTKEEQEANERAVAEGAKEQIAAYEFMTQHFGGPDEFAQTPENAAKMKAFLVGKNMPFTTESLEVAYQALKAAGQLSPIVLPALEPNSEVESTPVETNPWPWGTLTPEKVRDMSSTEMQRWMKNEKYGTEFQRQVNALRLTRGSLGLNY